MAMWEKCPCSWEINAKRFSVMLSITYSQTAGQKKKKVEEMWQKSK